jgi:NarL family two-component system response regulator LiaR
LGPGLNAAVLSVLSRREQEVLRALALGQCNKEISVELGVSVGTVKTHLRNIFRKLKVSDRTGAVLAALRADLPKAA